MPFGSPGAFPLPAAGGPPFLKFRQMQPDFAAVSHRHDYEDGGASFVAMNDTGPIYFELEYNGLTAAQAALILAHFADAGSELFGFSFTNPRTSTVYTDVHYAPDGFQEDHSRIWNNSFRIRLVKRPA